MNKQTKIGKQKKTTRRKPENKGGKSPAEQDKAKKRRSKVGTQTSTKKSLPSEKTQRKKNAAQKYRAPVAKSKGPKHTLKATGPTRPKKKSVPQKTKGPAKQTRPYPQAGGRPKKHTPPHLGKGKAKSGNQQVKKGDTTKKQQRSAMPDSWEKFPRYVPPEIEKMAGQVLKEYGLKAKNMVVMATKPMKGGAIWQVKTDKGLFSLKLLQRRPSRSLFSIGAQEYLVEQKAKVPPLVRTKDDQLYVEMGNKLWVVAKWIKSLTPAEKSLKGAKMLCTGLGEFHRLSRGYTPPAGAEFSSRLNRWPDYYEKIITKFGWFRNLAVAYDDTPAASTLLSALDFFAEQARAALTRLRQSSYDDLVARGESYWGLAHQDYGWGNGQVGPGGIWIIDLDGVAYDLPIRDLRKLIENVMKDTEKWDEKWVKEMIKAYHQANPIEKGLYEILLIDLSMPNQFYQFIKPIVYDPTAYLHKGVKETLNRMIKAEKSKQTVIENLADWKGDLE